MSDAATDWYGLTVSWIDRSTNWRTDELMDGWIDRWKDGWTDGRMDRGIDGRTDHELLKRRLCAILRLRLMTCRPTLE